MQELDASHISALCRGFFDSRLMLTAVELDLFSLFSGQWLAVEDVANTKGWNARALRILLDALVVTGLMLKRGGNYSTTELSAAYLSSGGDYSILDAAVVAVELWPKWSRLTECVVGTGAPINRDLTRSAVGAMHLLTPRIAPGIAALLRPELSRSFLDVGGGSGAFSIALLRRDRSLRATIFERPEVLPICAEYLREAELAESVVLVPGDYTHDEFPPNQGMVLLSAGIHELSWANVEDLLARAYRALLPGGRVVIRDYVMSPDRLQPREGALLAVTALVGSEGGTTYTFPEIRQMLTSVGYVDVRMLQDGESMNSVLEAYRPNQ